MSLLIFCLAKAGTAGPVATPGRAAGERSPAVPDAFAPMDNPPNRDSVELGRWLFNDKRLSADRSVSCASCHDPGNAFASAERVSLGVYGRTTLRNAPSLLDVGFYSSLMWDGRAGGLEEQAVYPLTGSSEMGITAAVLLDRLSADEKYRAKFSAAFGDERITLDRVVKALASYQRTLVTPTTSFDRYFDRGDDSLIGDAASRGWRVFRSYCIGCHRYDERNRFFSDFRYRSTGISDRSGPYDLGRFYYTANPDDKGRFRTPPLRNVASTAPYMHDGSLASLSAVVEYHGLEHARSAEAGSVTATAAMTDQQKRDLLAFLHSI